MFRQKDNANEAHTHKGARDHTDKDTRESET